MTNLVKDFAKDNSGATVIEYGLIVSRDHVSSDLALGRWLSSVTVYGCCKASLNYPANSQIQHEERSSPSAPIRAKSPKNPKSGPTRRHGIPRPGQTWWSLRSSAPALSCLYFVPW
jgi:hypothetical protein